MFYQPPAQQDQGAALASQWFLFVAQTLGGGEVCVAKKHLIRQANDQAARVRMAAVVTTSLLNDSGAASDMKRFISTTTTA